MNINRSIILTMVVLAFSFVVVPGQTALMKRVTTKTDKLDFGAGGTVVIVGAPQGSIRIEQAKGNEVEISAEIELQASTEADLARIAEVTGFALEESAGRIGIISTGTHDAKYLKRVSKKFPKKLVGLPFRIDYVLKVPRYCDLQIDGGKGDISISGIEGAMRINSLESNARLDLVGGGVNGTFGKGNVVVTMPDRSWRGNGIDIQVATGDMDVHLPANVSAELDAVILRSGKIENAFVDLKPRVRTARFTDKSIIAKAGGGGVPMKFTVGDGTLRLLRIRKAE